MSTQGESTSAPSRRVLVVDDNEDSVDSMVMLLELLGNQVYTARDGIEAIEAAERFRPELVLMDMGMPRMNGYDATRRIREQPVTDQELNDAKDYLIGSFPLRLDTNRRVASFLAQVEYFQLGLDYPERYRDLIRGVTRADVERVAKQYLDPEKLIIVVVGNQKKIGEK